VWHAHAIAGEITEVSHPCHRRGQVFSGDVQGDDDGIDASLGEQGIKDAWHL